MKKILTILFLSFFILTSECYAANLTFLYINGSNNNDEKMRKWYVNGINKFHPVLKKKIEKNQTLKQWSKDNKLVINPKPEIFFWGYNSKTDLEFVKDRLNISKAYSSVLAYEVKSILTQFLHDAIWVQKDHNMQPILDDLNKKIIALSKKDQNVFLFGYSAGTFVTHQYLLYKLPYINLEKLFTSLHKDKEFIQFVKDNPRQNTCLSALMHNKGNIGVLATSGHLVLNQDETELKKNYLNIDSATETYCAPPGRVKAVINYASPIPLFYSDMIDEKYELSFYNKLMFRYVMEEGIYFLTVNFREDPLGFPSNNNLTISQWEERMNYEFDNPQGLIYDNSKVWSRRSAIFAHTSYWTARKCFANAIVKSVINGTKFLYDEKYQNKVLQKKKDPEAVYDTKNDTKKNTKK